MSATDYIPITELCTNAAFIHSFVYYSGGPLRGADGQGGSVKVTCVRKMADAAALYCVFYLY